MKGRKQTPYHLKILQGNPGKRRLHKPEQIPVLGRPEPPEFLTGYALEEWHRVIAELEPLNVLCALDTMIIASYCSCYAHWREAEELIAELQRTEGKSAGMLLKSRGSYATQPLLRIAARNIELMNRIGAVLYLEPTSRQRLMNDPNRSPFPINKSKFDGLLGVPPDWKRPGDAPESHRKSKT